MTLCMSQFIIQSPNLYALYTSFLLKYHESTITNQLPTINAKNEKVSQRRFTRWYRKPSQEFMFLPANFADRGRKYRSNIFTWLWKICKRCMLLVCLNLQPASNKEPCLASLTNRAPDEDDAINTAPEACRYDWGGKYCIFLPSIQTTGIHRIARR